MGFVSSENVIDWEWILGAFCIALAARRGIVGGFPASFAFEIVFGATTCGELVCFDEVDAGITFYDCVKLVHFWCYQNLKCINFDQIAKT